VEIATPSCVLRPWRSGDEASLRENADDREVVRYLRERFPHPYTQADARWWVAHSQATSPATNLAIVVNDRASGGVGLILGTDVERCRAEVGYWLGRRYWGRGIASDALRAMTTYAFATFPLERIFATAAVENVASVRVLEKAGFVQECVMRRAAIKGGRVIDLSLHAIFRPPGAPEQDSAGRGPE
jgi:RimJ/RimL family protein N-acetyltransferase